jgi:cytochrome b subunit of formate dehydrogenase
MKVLLRNLEKIVHWTLLIIIVLYVISGLGIVYNNITELITFGLLTKIIAYDIHIYLLIPFLIILAAHIFFALNKK